MRVPLRGFLALADRLGVQLQDQLAGGRAQLPERLGRSLLREDLVGLGGVLITEDAGLLRSVRKNLEYPVRTV
jgi:hypothetical protein